jgi:hypothetical protein
MVEPQAECANNRTKVGYSSNLWRILDLWPNVAAAVKVNTLLEVAWRERASALAFAYARSVDAG